MNNYLVRLLANPLFVEVSEPDFCEFGTFGENIYATKPAKIRKVIMDAQGDFFSALPLLLDAGALPFWEEGLSKPRVLVFIVAVLIISPQ